MTEATLLDSSLFAQWLNDDLNLSESSIYTYKVSIEMFLKGNPDLDNLEDYNRFLIDHGIKKRNRHYFFVIKRFIQWKFEGNKTGQDLISGLVKMPMVYDIKRQRRHLSESQIFDIINLLKPKHRIMAMIMHLTGVRIGDVLRLRRGAIVQEQYQGREVLRINIIGKRKKSNTVYIHDKTAQEFIWHFISFMMDDPDYYFLDVPIHKDAVKTENARIRRNYIGFFLDLKIALNSVGIDLKDYSTHDFRRCFARRVWEKYKDVYVLQNLLNHSDPKTTLHYLDSSGLKNIDYHYEMQK